MNKRLYRSEKDKFLGGVCAGLGDFFGIDPTIVRLIFVLLTIFGGSAVLVYIILWLITPVEPTASQDVVEAAPSDTEDPSA